ncbi:MAG TPA: potassium channel protein [Bacteroidales bacterium]|nr:potassium channel protein [Bacteroidales bacterium]
MGKRRIEHKTAPMIRSAVTGLSLILVILVIGMVGYMIIEKLNPLDALYMTVITMATVGFREVVDFHDAGKLFTILLILGSFGIFGYVVTMLTRYVVDGVFTHFYKDNKVKKKIDKLSGHVIVCGFGRNGRQAAADLEDHNRDFLIIEKDPAIVEYLRRSTEYLYIEGDATREETLEIASIEKARALITTLPVDADNLFVVLTARQMHPDILIISRASDDNSDTKLKRAGATNVIMPDKIGGTRMARLVIDPDVVEFIDTVLLQPSGVRIEELSCKGLAACFADKSIKDLDIHNKTGANIIGLRDKNKEYIVNPPSDTILSPDDQLFVLGTEEDLESLKELMKKGV